MKTAERDTDAIYEAPKIVCLCGSTRFYKAFQRANYEETMAGNIVLSVGFYMHSSAEAHGETFGCTPEQKKALDALHLRKIEMSDEILVLNVGGYIGESTANEIAHATKLGKRIRYLEPRRVSLSERISLELDKQFINEINPDKKADT